jgi:hypothetical protein
MGNDQVTALKKKKKAATARTQLEFVSSLVLLRRARTAAAAARDVAHGRVLAPPPSRPTFPCLSPRPSPSPRRRL